MLKKFLSYYKPHRKLFFIDMLCAFLVALCNLFYPFITKNIINIYVPDKQIELIIVWAAVLLVIFILKAVLNFIIQYWGHIVGVRIQGDMRKEFFVHLQKLPFSFYDETKTGTLMSRLINDLMEISELAHHGPEDLFLSLITVIGAFILMSMINVWLTLIVFAALPLIVIVATLLRKRLLDVFKKTREETGEINARVESSVSGIRVSRAYNAEEHEIDKFETRNERFKAARCRAYKVMGVFHSSMNLLIDLLYLIVLIAGGAFFYYDLINVGEFAAIILYIMMLINPIHTLVSIYEQIQGGMTGFVRFREIREKQAEEDKSGAVEASKLNGDIEFEDVSFQYLSGGENSLVLDNLSLKVGSGSTVALVGPSGGGKTTLCHLIPRFYEINSGKISIDGIDIRDMTRASLRRNIGIVAQDVFLFGGTIRENIAYGNLDASEDEIIEAAKKAKIHEYVLTLPDGYDTQVGERGVKLSGGQKQRISIARAFLKNPPILILDEATSALDNVTELQIQESLEHLSEGRTTLIVAHRLSTVRRADEIIVLTENGIEERGNHEKLLETNGVYANLYRTSLRIDG